METPAELYQILAESLIGGVVFLVILMVIGIIGNVHVLFVYLFRMKSSNHRIFIVFLGVLDFLASVIAMPFTVVTLRQPDTFTKTPTCKLYWFANYFLCSASGLALLVIAIERYRKMCVPLGWQMTHRVALLLCFIILFVTIAACWSLLILIGTATIPTATLRIINSICPIEDKHNYDLYMVYHHTVLYVMVFICFVALVVMYVLIWRVIRKYKTLKQNRYKSSKETVLADSQAPKSQDSSNKRNMDRAKKDKVNLPPS